MSCSDASQGPPPSAPRASASSLGQSDRSRTGPRCRALPSSLGSCACCAGPDGRVQRSVSALDAKGRRSSQTDLERLDLLGGIVDVEIIDDLGSLQAGRVLEAVGLARAWRMKGTVRGRASRRQRVRSLPGLRGSPQPAPYVRAHAPRHMKRPPFLILSSAMTIESSGWSLDVVRPRILSRSGGTSVSDQIMFCGRPGRTARQRERASARGLGPWRAMGWPKAARGQLGSANDGTLERCSRQAHWLASPSLRGPYLEVVDPKERGGGGGRRAAVRRTLSMGSHASTPPSAERQGRTGPDRAT